jgi:hypothetical protein
MKIIPVEDNIEQIKNYFGKTSGAPNTIPKNTEARSFGNAYIIPRYSIPLNVTSSYNPPVGKSRHDVNIISNSESAVDQAKSEMKSDSHPMTLVSQDYPQSINQKHLIGSSHSSSVKRKRRNPPTSTPSKKYKTLSPIPTTSSKKKHHKAKKLF